MLQGYSVYHGEKEFHSTWHAHFYSKPPARPTPHFIEDILGLKSSPASQERQDVAKEYSVHKEIHDETKGTVAANIQSCIRKSKQRSKCKSRNIKGTITENRETTRSKLTTASTHKTTKREQMTPSAKSKQTQASQRESEVDVKKRKKARTTFTGRQIWELENTFKEKKYLTSTERNELAELLNVTDCQVKIWFQNRRTKYKKLEATTANPEYSPENGEEPRSAASSPVNVKESSITSEDSSADNEVSPSKDKISPDNFCIEQLISKKNEKVNEEIVNVCKNVDDGEV